MVRHVPSVWLTIGEYDMGAIVDQYGAHPVTSDTASWDIYDDGGTHKRAEMVRRGLGERVRMIKRHQREKRRERLPARTA